MASAMGCLTWPIQSTSTHSPILVTNHFHYRLMYLGLPSVSNLTFETIVFEDLRSSFIKCGPISLNHRLPATQQPMDYIPLFSRSELSSNINWNRFCWPQWYRPQRHKWRFPQRFMASLWLARVGTIWHHCFPCHTLHAKMRISWPVHWRAEPSTVLAMQWSSGSCASSNASTVKRFEAAGAQGTENEKGWNMITVFETTSPSRMDEICDNWCIFLDGLH